METSQQAQLAREGARKLQALSSSDRAALVHRVADTLQAQSALILETNAQDVADGKVAVAKGPLSDALAARLALNQKKIQAKNTSEKEKVKRRKLEKQKRQQRKHEASKRISEYGHGTNTTLDTST